MTNKRLMWVNNDFAKLLKIKAIENGKTVIGYTKELAKKGDKLKHEEINDNFWRIL